MGYFGDDDINEQVSVQGSQQNHTSANIAGGAGLIGGAVQSISAPFLQKWSQDYARHEAGQAWERSMKSWREQNEYNSPAQKMQRLREAGLNPALVYGKGIDTNASGAPSSPKADTPAFKYDMSGLMNSLSVLNQYQDVKKKSIENDYLNQNVMNSTIQNAWKTNIIREAVLQAISNTKSAEERAKLNEALAIIERAKSEMAMEGVLPGYDMSAGRIISEMEDTPVRDILLNALAGVNQIQKSLGVGFGKLNMGKKAQDMTPSQYFKSGGYKKWSSQLKK